MKKKRYKDLWKGKNQSRGSKADIDFLVLRFSCPLNVIVKNKLKRLKKFKSLNFKEQPSSILNWFDQKEDY